MKRAALASVSCALALLAACAADPTEPEVLAAPDHVDFGRVAVKCLSPEHEVCLYDAGNAPVALADLEIAGDPVFFFTSVAPTGSIIPAGGRLCVKMRFEPTALTAFEATMRATVDGLPAPLEVPLSGTGASAGTRTDTFTQLGRPQVDLVLVVDDAAATDDLALEANLRTFARFTQVQALDARVAVATTSAADNGALLPFDGSRSPFLSNHDPGFVDDLLADVAGRPRREDTPDRGLEAALRALVANVGLLRPDAALSVVVVSPTDDASTRRASDYVDAFHMIKGERRRNLFSFSFIGGGPEGCTSPEGVQLAAAPRYTEVQAHTGGVFGSGCGDWSRAISNLSLVAFGFKTRFFLNDVPLPGTLEVGITDAHGLSWTLATWTFDAAANAIDFDPSTMPEPPWTASATYEASCG